MIGEKLGGKGREGGSFGSLRDFRSFLPATVICKLISPFYLSADGCITSNTLISIGIF